jgi:hypothetical protein
LTGDGCLVGIYGPKLQEVSGLVRGGAGVVKLTPAESGHYDPKPSPILLTGEWRWLFSFLQQQERAVIMTDREQWDKDQEWRAKIEEFGHAAAKHWQQEEAACEFKRALVIACPPLPAGLTKKDVVQVFVALALDAAGLEDLNADGSPTPLFENIMESIVDAVEDDDDE